MKPQKYRAKRVDNNKWIEGTFSITSEGCLMHPDPERTLLNYVQVDPATLEPVTPVEEMESLSKYCTISCCCGEPLNAKNLVDHIFCAEKAEKSKKRELEAIKERLTKKGISVSKEKFDEYVWLERDLKASDAEILSLKFLNNAYILGNKYLEEELSKAENKLTQKTKEMSQTFEVRKCRWEKKHFGGERDPCYYWLSSCISEHTKKGTYCPVCSGLVEEKKESE